MFNFFQKRIKFFSGQKGFTMIETLVAISILLIALTGPLVLVRQGISSARLAKDQITAFYLAQDALEYVRSVRDGNIITNTSWLTGLEVCVGESNLCEIDTTTNDIDSCGVGCSFLRMSSASGLYGYDQNWTETKFKRHINILMNNSDEAVVEVVVSWDAEEKNFISRDYIFNLRKE